MDHREQQTILRKKLADIMGRKGLSFLALSKEIGINVAVGWAFLRRSSNIHQGNFYKIEQYVKKEEAGNE